MATFFLEAIGLELVISAVNSVAQYYGNQEGIKEDLSNFKTVLDSVRKVALTLNDKFSFVGSEVVLLPRNPYYKPLLTSVSEAYEALNDIGRVAFPRVAFPGGAREKLARLRENLQGHFTSFMQVVDQDISVIGRYDEIDEVTFQVRVILKLFNLKSNQGHMTEKQIRKIRKKLELRKLDSYYPLRHRLLSCLNKETEESFRKKVKKLVGDGRWYRTLRLLLMRLQTLEKESNLGKRANLNAFEMYTELGLAYFTSDVLAQSLRSFDSAADVLNKIHMTPDNDIVKGRFAEIAIRRAFVLEEIDRVIQDRMHKSGHVKSDFLWRCLMKLSPDEIEKYVTERCIEGVLQEQKKSLERAVSLVKSMSNVSEANLKDRAEMEKKIADVILKTIERESYDVNPMRVDERDERWSKVFDHLHSALSVVKELFDGDKETKPLSVVQVDAQRWSSLAKMVALREAYKFSYKCLIKKKDYEEALKLAKDAEKFINSKVKPLSFQKSLLYQTQVYLWFQSLEYNVDLYLDKWTVLEEDALDREDSSYWELDIQKVDDGNSDLEQAHELSESSRLSINSVDSDASLTSCL